MKAKQILIGGLILFAVSGARSQGTLTFVYDQQSATDSTIPEGAVSLQTAQPFGQSFTPGLSTVGFVQLALFNSSSASLFIDLQADSITGPVLGASDPITLSAGFSGFPTFSFSTPVSVTPGTTYFIHPVLISGNLEVEGSMFKYTGGGSIFQGIAGTDDIWFREGIVTPEPTVWSLLLVSGGALAFGWRRR